MVKFSSIYQIAYKNLILKLIAERKRQGLCQKDIAKKMEVSQKTISVIENLIQQISLNELIIYTHILDMDLLILIEEYERDFFLENLNSNWI